MEPTRQQVIDDIISEAHEADSRSTSAAAERIVSELHNLEASGHAWITEFLDDLAQKGAARIYADWRRRIQHAGRTSHGAEVEIPVFGAVREVGEDGSVAYVQLALFSMTLPQVIERRNQLARQRDTLSVEVRFLTDLAEMMEADPSLVTAGQAIARMDAA